MCPLGRYCQNSRLFYGQAADLSNILFNLCLTGVVHVWRPLTLLAYQDSPGDRHGNNQSGAFSELTINFVWTFVAFFLLVSYIKVHLSSAKMMSEDIENFEVDVEENPCHEDSFEEVEDIGEVEDQHFAAPLPHPGPRIPQMAIIEILEVEAERNSISKKMEGLLYEAMIKNKLNKVRGILRSVVHPDVELVNVEDIESAEYGCCPVHIACRRGRSELLQLLIECGCDVNIVDSDNETPLHKAARAHSFECVQLLLDHDAKVNSVTNCHKTALLVAVETYQSDSSLDTIEALLKRGCNVNLQDLTGLSPLHVAVENANAKLTELLLKHNANVNAQCEVGETPLMYAVEANLVKNISALLKSGCNTNIQNKYGTTALHLAVTKRSDSALVMTQLLVAAGSDFNLKNLNGESAVFWAAHLDTLDVLWLLLDAGADINTTSDWEGSSLLLRLTRNRCVQGVKKLLSIGANPNIENKLGTTPVWAAVRNCDIELVKVMIQANCDLDIASVEKLPIRPICAFQLAIEEGYFSIARVLGEAGCRIKPVWYLPERVPVTLTKNPEMMKWIENHLCKAPSLRVLCRWLLRSRLDLNIEQKLDCVVFPQPLKDFILMKDL